jgi:mannose/fructose/N-acetylgalactosamine-specific phosphotransferase system component IID
LIRITGSSPAKSYMEYTLMTPLIYQYVIVFWSFLPPLSHLMILTFAKTNPSLATTLAIVVFKCWGFTLSYCRISCAFSVVCFTPKYQSPCVCEMVRNRETLLGLGVVSTLPTTVAGGSPLVCCPQLFI